MCTVIDAEVRMGGPAANTPLSVPWARCDTMEAAGDTTGEVTQEVEEAGEAEAPRPTKRKREKKTKDVKEEVVGDRAKAEWEKYVKYIDKRVQINMCLLDTNRANGQIRRLQDERVVRYYHNIVQRQPLELHRVLLWEANVTGVHAHLRIPFGHRVSRGVGGTQRLWHGM